MYDESGELDDIPDCSKLDLSFSMAHPLNPPAAFHLEMQDQYCYNTGVQDCSFKGEKQYQTYPDLSNMYPCSSPNSQVQPPHLFGLMLDPALPSSLVYHHSFPNRGDYGDREICPNQNGEGVVSVSGVKKHSACERQKREEFNNKYEALKALIPNPTKEDRASIVGDTIEYISDLKRTVSELKALVEKKKKKKKTSEVKDDSEESSCRVHRKSRNTEVDVRIVETDVTIKLLVQRRRINCLLFVSKALDHLHLELHHVSGGAIGDFYTYLINSKISQGSNVYASAVANKVIQLLDQHYTRN